MRQDGPGPHDTVLAISHRGIIELPIVALGQRLGAPLRGPAFRFLEGARVTDDGRGPKTIVLLRVVSADGAARY